MPHSHGGGGQRGPCLVRERGPRVNSQGFVWKQHLGLKDEPFQGLPARTKALEVRHREGSMWRDVKGMSTQDHLKLVST